MTSVLSPAETSCLPKQHLWGITSPEELSDPSPPALHPPLPAQGCLEEAPAPALGREGNSAPHRGKILFLCLHFRFIPGPWHPHLAPISHHIPPACTKQIKPALNLDFLQAPLIAQGATCTESVPSSPTAVPETLCLFPLFHTARQLYQQEGLIRMILPVCPITHEIFPTLLRFGTTPRDLIDFFVWL